MDRIGNKRLAVTKDACQELADNKKDIGCRAHQSNLLAGSTASHFDSRCHVLPVPLFRSRIDFFCHMVISVFSANQSGSDPCV